MEAFFRIIKIARTVRNFFIKRNYKFIVVICSEYARFGNNRAAQDAEATQAALRNIPARGGLGSLLRLASPGMTARPSPALDLALSRFLDCSAVDWPVMAFAVCWDAAKEWPIRAAKSLRLAPLLSPKRRSGQR